MFMEKKIMGKAAWGEKYFIKKEFTKRSQMHPPRSIISRHCLCAMIAAP